MAVSKPIDEALDRIFQASQPSWWESLQDMERRARQHRQRVWELQAEAGRIRKSGAPDGAITAAKLARAEYEAANQYSQIVSRSVTDLQNAILCLRRAYPTVPDSLWPTLSLDIRVLMGIDPVTAAGDFKRLWDRLVTRPADASKPSEPPVASEWYSAAELGRKLGVPERRLIAFRIALYRMRARRQLPDDAWQEVRDRRTKKPRYLFRPCPAIDDRAGKYRQ